MNSRIHAIGGAEESGRLVAELCSLVSVEPLGSDLYRGACTNEPWPRVFGGQVVAQALDAARRSSPDDRTVHSLHAYFIRAGDVRLPIVYRVERDRDGASFSARRVVALQNGLPIFTMAASFHRAESGFAHGPQMPTVAPPEQLTSVWDIDEARKNALPAEFRELATQRRAIDFRRVEPRPKVPDHTNTCQHLWFRCVAPLPGASALHSRLLAYASDSFLLEATLLPHGIEIPEASVGGASIDHAVYFHDTMRADEWLLYVQESDWSGGGRGLAHAKIYSRDGRLVASVFQEGLIRPRRSGAGGRN